MQTKLLIVIVIFVLTGFRKEQENYLFSIHFTRCFENDTVSVKLNRLTLADNLKITTYGTAEITDLYLWQDSKNLWVDNGSKKVKLKKLKIHDNLNIDVVLNGFKKSFSITLQQGKYLLIDKCSESDSASTDNLNLTQRVRPPIFD